MSGITKNQLLYKLKFDLPKLPFSPRAMTPLNSHQLFNTLCFSSVLFLFFKENQLLYTHMKDLWLTLRNKENEYNTIQTLSKDFSNQVFLLTKIKHVENLENLRETTVIK